MAFNNSNTDILVAGAIAAFTVDLLVYPLDTIKTRLQSPDYKRLYKNASTNNVNRSLFRGLYQGIGSVIIATVPSCMAYSNLFVFRVLRCRFRAFFTTYEATKLFLHNTNPTLPSSSPLLPVPIVHALASSVAELVSCLILTPAEVLKQNAQMVRKFSSTSSIENTKSRAFDGNATITALRKFNSPAQLWRGYTALAGRNLPFTAMQFPMFEFLRSSIHMYRKRKGVSTGTLLETGFVTALSAGTAGSVAAIVTTPIDVVKTRIMLSAGDESEIARHRREVVLREVEVSGGELGQTKKASRASSQGALAIAKEILRIDGAKGFFRGGALRALWTALGSGLYLGVYESGRRYLEERRVEGSEGNMVS